MSTDFGRQQTVLSQCLYTLFILVYLNVNFFHTSIFCGQLQATFPRKNFSCKVATVPHILQLQCTICALQTM